jgi:hypothetical protein
MRLEIRALSYTFEAKATPSALNRLVIKNLLGGWDGCRAELAWLIATIDEKTPAISAAPKPQVDQAC